MKFKMTIPTDEWKTKPTDRFVLKWIKLRLSARITPRLAKIDRVRPWMCTVFSAGIGFLAGVVYGLGAGWGAAILGAVSQVMDGVDGQLSRLTGRSSALGAFLDSVLDRYADGGMMIGSAVFAVRFDDAIPVWAVLGVGTLAFIGANLVSYASARAQGLGLDIGPPTLASKGTRMSAMVIGAAVSPFWVHAPFVILCYLALHSHAALGRRLLKASAGTGGDGR